MHHSELLGKSDRELLDIALEATHQHFKGGLYRYLGPIRDADTGVFILGKDGKPRECYLHVFPYYRELWVRDFSEWHGRKDFNGEINAIERFRELKR